MTGNVNIADVTSSNIESNATIAMHMESLQGMFEVKYIPCKVRILY